MKIFIKLQGYFTCKLCSAAVQYGRNTKQMKGLEIIFSVIIGLLSPEMHRIFSWYFSRQRRGGGNFLNFFQIRIPPLLLIDQ